MTAIAIPIPSSFGPEHHDGFAAALSRSPYSRSPFRRCSLSSSASSPAKASFLNSITHHHQIGSDISGIGSTKVVLPAAAAADVAAQSQLVRPTPVVPAFDPLPSIHSGSFIENFRQALLDIDIDECDAHGENAFFVCDLGQVYKQHQRWMKELGARVQPFFAVKSNPDPYVLRLMASLGLGFDCASQPEISAVLSLSNRPDPNRIIYANPCKAASFVRHAAKNGVDYMTFDNGDELTKVKRYHPNAKMVLRILTDDSSSLCRLGLKFGAPLSEVRGLLKKAKELDINVVGISFHCGSGCKDPELFGDAIRRARWAFDVGAEHAFNFGLLDIGGGFEDNNFELIAAVLRKAIAEHFPLDAQGNGVRIIAEPGRYYVSRAFELATNIIARRAAREGTNAESDMVGPGHVADFEMDEDEEESESKPAVMYYINDGVYGAFNCTLFDHQVVHPKVMTLGEDFVADASFDSTLEECSVWGPTCDSIDLVQPKAQLPVGVLAVGDWLRWEEMGAYTICAASQFNGFRKSLVRYTIDADVDTEAAIRRLINN
ncbi:BQ2448_7979 [Microbotryum intermedium]|uniref:ornithine decarboxylase n=1 Tax=Microbotryum intermedium TaxID=269621 RepID=A0A238FMG3_9BASI|nr:BQ2448_7979 [Microbotryum intermedium]